MVTQTGVGILDILDILDFGCINKRYSSNALRDDSQMFICYYPYYLLLNNINFKIFNIIIRFKQTNSSRPEKKGVVFSASPLLLNQCCVPFSFILKKNAKPMGKKKLKAFVFVRPPYLHDV